MSMLPSDIMVLLQQDPEKLEELMKPAKRLYVLQHHTQAISHMTNASGYKKDKWKTYIYEQGKRKEIIRKTEEEIMEFLYEYYSQKERRSLEQVFQEMILEEEMYNNRARNTILDKKCKFNLFGDLRFMMIDSITEEDIKKWVNDFLSGKYITRKKASNKNDKDKKEGKNEKDEKKSLSPKKDFFKRELQLINQIFEYAIEHKYITVNPAAGIRAKTYYNKCDCSVKPSEQRAFSEEEVAKIRDDILHESRVTGASLAQLLSSCTAMRMGELLGLHKEDIQDDFIHVHRQYVREYDSNGKGICVEREYTKNERKNPNGGRLIPITKEARKAIDLAMQLPGDSEYLFHGKDGNPVKPNAYINNLKRRCRRLGIKTTNNHAFRINFNSELNHMGLSPADRALVLGHTVETNERFYSVSDKRRIDTIAEIMKGKKGS